MVAPSRKGVTARVVRSRRAARMRNESPCMPRRILSLRFGRPLATTRSVCSGVFRSERSGHSPKPNVSEWFESPTESMTCRRPKRNPCYVRSGAPRRRSVWRCFAVLPARSRADGRSSKARVSSRRVRESSGRVVRDYLVTPFRQPDVAACPRSPVVGNSLPR